MSLSELKFRVRRAIDKFYANDSKLFSVGVSEWAMAHRLAIYLEQEISGWNVDCEYNKQGENLYPKINIKAKGKTKRTRPDIILHHRGEILLEHNLLVVELKKHRNKSDWKKAKEFTAEPEGKRTFQYQYGLALSFLPVLEQHWFYCGVEIKPKFSQYSRTV